GRGAARGVGDRVEGEVVAQERELEHREGDRQDPRERVHRAPARLRELDAAAAHPVHRRADPVRAYGEAEQQTGESEAGHQGLAPARMSCEERQGTQAFWFSPAGAVLYLDGHLVINELRSPM